MDEQTTGENRFLSLVLLARPLFSVLLYGGGKKGLDQFTVATRPDTFESVNKIASSKV